MHTTRCFNIPDVFLGGCNVLNLLILSLCKKLCFLFCEYIIIVQLSLFMFHILKTGHKIFRLLFFGQRVSTELIQFVEETSSSPKSSNASSNVDGNVVFSSKTFEKLVVSNGGQLVSRDGIKVLKNRHSSSNEKICYVVHLSGSFDLHNIINSSVVLKHISQHKLCNIKPVNPIWLKTCEMNNVVVDPTCMEYDRLVPTSNNANFKNAN